MKLKLVIFTAIFALSLSVQAQIPYVDSKEVLIKGVEAFDSGAIKKAIEYYRMVPEGDTNYATALFELANAYASDSAFDKAKETITAGLAVPHNIEKRLLLISLANVYDYMQKTDSALLMYDSLTKLYPMDNQPYYEKAVLYLRKMDYDKTIANLHKSLLLNPYHTRSHIILGTAYALQGRLSEAFIALECGLLTTNDKELGLKTTRLIGEITSETDEIAKYYESKAAKYSHPLFDEIDQIVNAKLALNKEYKLKSELDDEVFRQAQVIMEKLTYDPKDTNFVMQYYVPLLTEMYSKNMFEPFELFLFSGYGISSVEKSVADNKSGIDDVKNIAYPYLNQILGTRTLNYKKRQEMPSRYHRIDDGNTVVEGILNPKDKKTFMAGPITAYEKNTLLATGAYDANGKRTGVWKRYYSTGELKEESTYKADLPVGIVKEYATSGVLTNISTYDEKGSKIEEHEFSNSGYPTSSRKLLPGDVVESITYYLNGQKEVTLQLKNDDAIDGTYTYYHDNGKPKRSLDIKKGKLQGPVKEYYENGKVKTEGVFEAGEKEGDWKAYHENGQLYTLEHYHEGKEEGAYEERNAAGKVTTTGNFVKGKKQGPFNYNTEAGEPFSVFTYNNDLLVGVKYIDNHGKTVYNKEDNKGIHNYDIYYPNGAKKASITHNDKDELDGKITYYYASGTIKQEVPYTAGKINGKGISYYTNGIKSEEYEYSDDKLDGYHKSYFKNGIVKNEGWYKDGLKQGVWRYYYTSGKPDNELYYLNDEINGYIKNYRVNGELGSKELYEMGLNTGLIEYDTTGKMISKQDYPLGHGKYTRHYLNGAMFLECDMKYGLLNGKYKILYPDKSINETGKYIYGKRDSLFTLFYPNGKVSTKGMYLKNKKEGEWLSYSETGDLESQENYHDDENEGEGTYYAGGLLRYKYNYHEDEKDGPQTIYGEDKKIACVLNYQEGIPISYTYEGKDGKLLPEIDIKNGTADINTFYANGEKATIYHLVNGGFEGQQLLYYSNGQLAEDKTYKQQVLDGPYKRYFPNGKLYYESVYKNDLLHGNEKMYADDGQLVTSRNYIYGVLHGPLQITAAKNNKPGNYYFRYGLMQETK